MTRRSLPELLTVALVRAPLLPARALKVAWTDDAEAVRTLHRQTPSFATALASISPRLAEELSNERPPGAAVAALRRYVARASSRCTPFAGLAGVAEAEFSTAGLLQPADGSNWRTHETLSFALAQRALVTSVMAAREPVPLRINRAARVSAYALLGAGSELARAHVRLVRSAELLCEDEVRTEILHTDVLRILSERLSLAASEAEQVLEQLLTALVLVPVAGLSPYGGPYELQLDRLSVPQPAVIRGADEGDAETESHSLPYQVVSAMPVEGALARRPFADALGAIAALPSLWSPRPTLPHSLWRALDDGAPNGELPFLHFARRLAPMSGEWPEAHQTIPSLDPVVYVAPPWVGSSLEGGENRSQEALVQWLTKSAAAARTDGRRCIELPRAAIEKVNGNRSHDAPSELEALTSYVCHNERPATWLQVAYSDVGHLSARFLGIPEAARLLTQTRDAWRMRDSDAIAAEVTWLGRGMADVAAHPPLLDYQIVLDGAPTVGKGNVIPLEDLVVRSAGGDVSLWSRRLQKRVLPKLLSAVCLSNMNALERLLFHFDPTRRHWCFPSPEQLSVDALPRVIFGDVILSPAYWRPPVALRRVAEAAQRTELERWVRRWLAEAEIPRIVALGMIDGLAIDVQHKDGEAALLSWLRRNARNPAAALREVFEPAPSHDRVLEVVAYATTPRVTKTPAPDIAPTPIEPLCFDLASPWLYLKLYAPAERHDALLAALVPDLLAAAHEYDDLANVHFVRFFDGLGPHVRLRLEWRERTAHAGLTKLMPRLAEAVRHQELVRWMIDLYKPELARYGGLETWRTVQSIFTADTRFALTTLRASRLDPRLDLGPCAMQATHVLLREVFERPSERLAELLTLRERWDRELCRTLPDAKPRLARHYAEERSRYEDALRALEHETTPSLDQPLAALASAVRGPLRTIAPHLRTRPAMLQAILHMLANRLLGSREREAVMHSFHHRAYDSLLARGALDDTHG